MTLEDLAIADRALRAHDLPHALSHLARAFVVAPGDERLHALLETAAQRADLLAVLPDDHFVGTELIRAWSLRRAGRVSEAVALLAQAVVVESDRGFETVLASWLSAASAGGVALTPAACVEAARALVAANGSTIGFHSLAEGEAALLRGYGDLALALLPFGDACPEVRPPIAGTLRRVGRLAESRAVAAEAAGAGDRGGSIQLGLALRAAGEGAAAAEIFARLRADAPDDEALTTEEARSHFAAGDEARALATLRFMPALHSEARALAQRCEAGGAEADRLALLDRLHEDAVRPTIGTPFDATANLLAGGEAARGGGVKTVAVSGWESPSNRLLVALSAAGTNDVAAVAYSLKSDDRFDPVTPRRGRGPTLWERRGDVVVQALPAPPEAVRRAVAGVAAAGPSLPELWPAARALATSGAAPSRTDLVAALVHAPTDEAWRATLPAALYRYQVAGACVLANTAGGWESLGPIFEGILFGPVDWAAGAAVTALGELARRDPAAARPARAMLVDLIDDLLPHSCEPRFLPLASALGALPAVPGGFLQRLEEWEHANLGGLPADAVAPSAAPSPAAPPPGAAPAAPPPGTAPAFDGPTPASLPVPGGWRWPLGASAVIATLVLLARHC